MTEIIVTDLTPRDYTPDEVAKYVIQKYDEFKEARMAVEDTWLDCWALYMSTPESMEHMRDRTLQVVGEVNNSWRHKMNLGKAFESVEMLFSYFMQAMFPSGNWFDVVSQMPGQGDLARSFKKLIAFDIDNSNFYLEFASFMRQLIITGTSHISVTWCEKEQYNKFECLENFDCFNDPEARNVNDGDFIRRYFLTKAEVIERMKKGDWNEYPLELLEKYIPNNSEPDWEVERVREFAGINRQEYFDKVEVIEFWGDVELPDITIKNQIVTIVGPKMMSMKDNTYDCRPIVSGSYIPVVRQPYGIGAIQPSLGCIVAQNGMVNQRADGIEISINPMYTLRQNSAINAQDVYSEPGKVFPVENHDDLAPVRQDASVMAITYQELQYLESVIDKNFGTIPLVGLGQTRKGERVTATEIEAIRNAGGSRLLSIHLGIEKHSLQPILWRIIWNYKKFLRKSKVVRIAGEAAGEFLYIEVPKEVKDLRYYITPAGTQSVVDRQVVIERVTSFAGFVGQIPEMSQNIDWTAMTKYVLDKWGFDEPEAFLKKQESQPSSPVEKVSQQAEQIGGAPAKNALEANMMSDGGQSMMQSLMNALNAKTPVLEGTGGITQSGIEQPTGGLPVQ